MKTNFKDMLERSLHSPEIEVDKSHLQHTLLSVRREMLAKQSNNHITFRNFLILQIRFIAWKIWLQQGLVLVILSFIFTSFVKANFYDKRYIAILLCNLSIVILMTSIPLIQRSIYYQMHECESASYFSTARLLMAKLLIIGIGDIIMLGGLLLITIWSTYLNIGSALLYLILPFLLALCCYLYLLGHIPAKWFSSYCIGLCSLLYLCIVLLNRFVPVFFQQNFSIGWKIVCLLFVFLCFSQLRYIIYDSEYAELQL